MYHIATANAHTTVPTAHFLRQPRRAHLVSIDTEGWDSLVLQGMSRALAEHRIDVVEFEYMRAWKRIAGEFSMRTTLQWLDSLGYTCFWQGNFGALAEASGNCWQDAFHRQISHRWSNLVCSYRPDIVRVFREIR